jgi:hypothetical protein
MRKQLLGWMSALGLIASGWLIAVASAQPKDKDEEHERVIKESEVPPPALAALKKFAGGATILKIEEETEHGTRFFEGSWKTAAGSRMEVLVTTDGDLVETEEAVQADVVPKAVLAAAHKEAGKDAKMYFEKRPTSCTR